MRLTDIKISSFDCTKIYLLLFFLFFLIIQCITLFLLLKKEKESKLNIHTHYSGLLIAREEQIIQLKNNLIHSLLNDNYALDPNIILQDIEGNILSLNDLRYMMPALILYSSGISCKSCIEDIISIINPKEGKYSSLSTIILISNKNLLELSKFSRLSEINTYFVSLSISKTERHKNYLFIIDKDLRIHSFVEINEFDTDLIEMFLEDMYSKY